MIKYGTKNGKLIVENGGSNTFFGGVEDDPWICETYTEEDLITASNYKRLRIVPPEGYEFDEIDFLMQICRAEVGTASATYYVGIHDRIGTGANAFALNGSVTNTPLFWTLGGQVCNLGNFNQLGRATSGQSITYPAKFPLSPSAGSAVMQKHLHNESYASDVFSVNISTNFDIEHLYFDVRYKLRPKRG